MRVTIDIPEDLARKLGPDSGRVAEILELGLSERGWLNCALAEEIVSLLARRPTPEEIIAFRPSETAVERGRELLEKNRQNTLTLEEERELESMARLNRFFMELKARVRRESSQAE